MFPNLNAEMGRAKLTIKSLAEISDINYESLKLKLRGVTEFKLGEMLSIKRNAFPDKSLDYLFQIADSDSGDKDEEVGARINLTPKKIADGHAECDVRLVAGQKK